MLEFARRLTVPSALSYFKWKALKRPSVIVKVRGGPRFEMRDKRNCANNDYGVAWEVFVEDFYASDAIPGGEIFQIVDMGVNVGLSTLKFLHRFPSAQVLGFEPHPQHAAQARRNFSLNSAASRVQLEEAAVGATNRTLRLYDNMSGSRLTEEVREDTFEVAVVDVFERLQGRKIDLLKMDIEGGEYEVMADPRFAALNIPHIVMEWHRRSDAAEDKAWIEKTLHDAGYATSDIFVEAWGGMLRASKPEMNPGPDRFCERRLWPRLSPNSWKREAPMDRRELLACLGGLSCFALPYRAKAAALRKKVKITDVKVMIVRGTWDWNLVKIETDAGVSGIGEAYWGPGVKDIILNRLKGDLVGEDPLNVVKLYTKCLLFNGGYGAIAGVTVEAASGIEIALWDLAGRLIGVPVCDLLGGRFRDRVRFYRTLQAPANHPEEPQSWGDQAAEAKANNPFGFTAFKVQGDAVPRTADPGFKEPGHDPYTNQLTNLDISRLVDRMDRVRAALGGTDFAIECHWKYSVNDAIKYCNAVEHVKPMWVEDPTPPENVETMERVSRATDTPICTGENLYGLSQFAPLILRQATSGVHIDIPKSGGLFEAKRISDLADLYGIWTACHNPASPVGTTASAHAASSVRNFRIHELANWVDWWPTLVTRPGPFWKDGYFEIEDKPGLGFDIDPDVAKAHLAPGETWWG